MRSFGGCALRWPIEPGPWVIYNAISRGGSIEWESKRFVGPSRLLTGKPGGLGHSHDVPTDQANCLSVSGIHKDRSAQWTVCALRALRLATPTGQTIRRRIGTAKS